MSDILIKVTARFQGMNKVIEGYVFSEEWESGRKYVFVYQRNGERDIYVRDYVSKKEGAE